jgi:hypothetical protein
MYGSRMYASYELTKDSGFEQGLQFCFKLRQSAAGVYFRVKSLDSYSTKMSVSLYRHSLYSSP